MTVLPSHVEVAVVGGGQAGLAVSWYLRRAAVRHVVLDRSPRPGGAWPEVWPALRLFSPASYSSLPGWPMPESREEYPAPDEVVEYLRRYEDRYGLPVHRPAHVTAVTPTPDGRYRLRVDGGPGVSAGVVVSATGTWSRPFWPRYPGAADFRGRAVHTAGYRGAEDFRGARVLVVGGGNSGAQIAAELAAGSDVTWATPDEPRFLPDDVDGRVLFDVSTARARRPADGPAAPDTAPTLGDIVAVARVRQARDAGLLNAVRPPARFTPTGAVWPDGTARELDAVVWCTGFRPALGHLRPLRISLGGRIPTGGSAGTRSTIDPAVWLVGYGDWTGPASATLVGAARTARDTSREIIAHLR